jgi:rhodanese-related sulfurtransferase
MCHKPFALFGAPTLVAIWSAATVAASGMSVADLQNQLAKAAKITVIDVRSPTLFAQGHIPGAINVPGSLCAQKKLPPMGKVVVCAEGLGRDDADQAAAALAAKPGITVEVLEGGFAAWESAQSLTTRGRGMKPEAPNYITYSQLKAAKAEEVVLVDLRRRSEPMPQSRAPGAVPASQPLTDLAQEFPGLRSSRSPFDLPSAKPAKGGPSTTPIIVLIDDGDGTAQAMARKLKANGMKQYVILAGGEMILSRHGQAGLQRSGSSSGLLNQSAGTSRTTH